MSGSKREARNLGKGFIGSLPQDVIVGRGNNLGGGRSSVSGGGRNVTGKGSVGQGGGAIAVRQGGEWQIIGEEGSNASSRTQTIIQRNSDLAPPPPPGGDVAVLLELLEEIQEGEMPVRCACFIAAKIYLLLLQVYWRTPQEGAIPCRHTFWQRKQTGIVTHSNGLQEDVSNLSEEEKEILIPSQGDYEDSYEHQQEYDRRFPTRNVCQQICHDARQKDLFGRVQQDPYFDSFEACRDYQESLPPAPGNGSGGGGAGDGCGWVLISAGSAYTGSGIYRTVDDFRRGRTVTSYNSGWNGYLFKNCSGWRWWISRSGEGESGPFPIDVDYTFDNEGNFQGFDRVFTYSSHSYWWLRVQHPGEPYYSAKQWMLIDGYSWTYLNICFYGATGAPPEANCTQYKGGDPDGDDDDDDLPILNLPPSRQTHRYWVGGHGQTELVTEYNAGDRYSLLLNTNNRGGWEVHAKEGERKRFRDDFEKNAGGIPYHISNRYYSAGEKNYAEGWHEDLYTGDPGTRPSRAGANASLYASELASHWNDTTYAEFLEHRPSVRRFSGGAAYWQGITGWTNTQNIHLIKEGEQSFRVEFDFANSSQRGDPYEPFNAAARIEGILASRDFHRLNVPVEVELDYRWVLEDVEHPSSYIFESHPYSTAEVSYGFVAPKYGVTRNAFATIYPPGRLSWFDNPKYENNAKIGSDTHWKEGEINIGGFSSRTADELWEEISIPFQIVAATAFLDKDSLEDSSKILNEPLGEIG